MTYDAFISYSHGNDARVAESIEAGLKRFAKPWYRRRALHVFRDTSALSASPGLWTSIAAAMDDSEHLVVLCSPDAAASPWVGREIEQWRSTKPAGRIMLALTAGALVWSNELGGFDPALSTAAHGALAGAFTEEPLYVDMRWAHGADQLTLRNPRFQDQIADLAAPMHGVPKDALIGEEMRQHRRTMRVAIGALIVMALLAIAAVAGAISSKNNADEARRRLAENVKLHGTVEQNKRDLADSQTQLDATNGRLVDAQQNIVDANQKLGDAVQSAQAYSAQANEAAVRADAATRAQMTAENGQARALSQLRTTLAQELTAQQAAAAANQQALDAQKKAGQATADALVAAQNEQNAKAGEADANASAAQTRLATAATDPNVENRSLDLALLLADAATKINASSASSQADARSALLSVVQASGPVQRFFYNTEKGLPQAFGKVTVSTDNRWIAAAEDSDNIQAHGNNGKTRIFVWDASNPQAVRAMVWTAKLNCVSDMHFTASDELVTVDDADGCLNPAIVAQQTLGSVTIDYVQSNVVLWDQSGGSSDPMEGVAPRDASPVAIAPGGRYLEITTDSHARFADGSPISEMVVADTLDLSHLDILVGRPGAFLAQPTFSKSGRYLMGYDFLLATQSVWDMHTFEAPANCNPMNPVEQDSGCFRELAVPADQGVASLSPDEQHFAVANFGSNAVSVYDINSGAGVAGPITTGTAVTSFSLGDSDVALLDSANNIKLVRWTDPGLPSTGVPFAATPGCQPIPEVSATNKLLFVDQICTAPGQFERTTVFDLSAHLKREVLGRVTSSLDDRRIVTRQLDFTNDTVRIGFEIWDFGSSSPIGVLVASRTGAQAVVSPSGTTVVSSPFHLPGATEGSAEVWTADRAVSQPLPGSLGTRGVAFADDAHVVGFGTMLSGVEWDATKRPYDMLYNTPGSLCAGSVDPVDNLLRVDISPDGRTRAVSTDAHTIKIVDIETNATISTIHPALAPGERINFMAFTRGDGRRLVINVETPHANPQQDDFRCRNGDQKRAIVVQLDAGLRQDPEPGEFRTSSLDGGRLLFSSLDGSSLVVRDAGSPDTIVGKEFSSSALPLPSHGIRVYNLDPHGGLVAGTNSSGQIVVWSVSGEVVVPVGRFNVGAVEATSDIPLPGLAFSPNGDTLAVKTVDHRLFLFGMTVNAPPPRSTAIPLDAASRVTWSPDGSLIAIDGSYLFDSATLRQIGPKLRPIEWDNAVFDRGTVATRFVQDGDAVYLITERTGETAAARWRVDTGGLRRSACGMAGREFSAAEMSRYSIFGLVGKEPC